MNTFPKNTLFTIFILFCLLACGGKDANTAPVAVDDTATMSANTTLTINVLRNDSDADGDAIIVSAVTVSPAHGTAMLSAGKIEYTPDIDFEGTDTFHYLVLDSSGDVDEGRVTIEVVADVLNDTASINGGTFEMGNHSAVAGEVDELPVHSVTLDSFIMGTHEVTFAQYITYLNYAYGAGTIYVDNNDIVRQYIPNNPGTGLELTPTFSWDNDVKITWDGVKFTPILAFVDFPMVQLTWYGAVLYCNYLSEMSGRTSCYDAASFACDYTADGFRLPTEAEWEYASRGGEYGPYFQYPWASNSIGSGDANYGNNVGATEAVGTYAANGYGLFDMGGNAREWCGDMYDANYYSSSPSSNPTGAASGQRVNRGGDFATASGRLRCAARWETSESFGYGDLGFRVVVEP